MVSYTRWVYNTVSQCRERREVVNFFGIVARLYNYATIRNSPRQRNFTYPDYFTDRATRITQLCYFTLQLSAAAAKFGRQAALRNNIIRGGKKATACIDCIVMIRKYMCTHAYAKERHCDMKFSRAARIELNRP